MLLETVMEALDLESIVGVLHLYYPTSDDKNNVQGVSDRVVIEGLLPKVLKNVLKKGHEEGEHVLQFVLRHQLSYLNFLFHLKTLALQNRAMDFSAVENAFSRDMSSDRTHLGYMLQPDHWVTPSKTNGTSYLPVIGFTDRDVFVLPRAVGSCRAFDAKSITFCDKAADDIFCTAHASEQWWNKDTPPSSLQAQAYQHFANTRLFRTTDYKSLTRLVSEFWASYQLWKRSRGTSDMPVALERLAILNEKELAAMGLKGLRERFLRTAMKLTPEAARGSGHLLQIKDAYNYLRERLELQQLD